MGPGSRLQSHLGDSLDCPLQNPARGTEKPEVISRRKKRMTLPRSSNELENGLEAFPICKEAHPSCPIQAVILSGRVLSCYTESFSP